MRFFKLPSVITKAQAEVIQRTATTHIQVAQEGIAQHYAVKDGVTYLLNEMTLSKEAIEKLRRENRS